ncbi:MAG: YadA-like family protein [Sphingomonadaceae bacterium]
MHGSNLHAQTDPVLDICTGISVNQSDVSNLLKAVNNPIVTPIQGKINSLLGVLGALPLSLPSTLSVNVDGIVDTAISGNPIGLSVLDTDGNIIAPGNCNVTTDGYALNTEGGLAIGGNQITGLGQNGLTANAGTLDSIALGNNASTDAGAAGAIAIGTGASVTAGNSVALGTGSLADRGALTGYTAPGLSGTYNSVGSLSVGSTGNLRQITNVAPGTQASDAATVGQVQGALDAVAALDTAAVQYDDASKGTVTLGGASGTLVTNVAAGTLSNTSSDAVNGSQLYATNQNVTLNTNNIAALDTRMGNVETQLTNVDARVTTNTNTIAALDTRVSNNETQITNLDARITTNTNAISSNTTAINAIDNRVTSNETQITAIDARVTDNTTAITNLQTQVAQVPLGYVSDTDRTTSSASPTNTAALIGASAAPVVLTNVADGTVAAGSSEAVNGSQLAASNARIAVNETNIANNSAEIQNLTNNIAGSTVVAAQYSNPDTPTHSNGGTVTNDVTLVGAVDTQPVALHNVANARTSTDAVNLGQMNTGLDMVMSAATGYVDSRIADLRFDLDEVRRDSHAGTAGAMAFAGIPQTTEAGRSMLAGAVSHYRGQTAFAFGYSIAAQDGPVIKVGASVDSRGYAGVTAGAGISF